MFEGGYHVEMANLVDTVTEGQRVVVSVRPEEFSLNPEGMECEIISRTFLGKYTNYFLRFGDGMVLSVRPMGGDALVEVAFDKIGTKQLML